MDRNNDIIVLEVQNGFVHYAMNQRRFHKRFDRNEIARTKQAKLVFQKLEDLTKQFSLETDEEKKKTIEKDILQNEILVNHFLNGEKETQERFVPHLFVENEHLNKPDLI